MRRSRCRRVYVVAEDSGILVAHVEIAESLLARSVGLLGRKHLAPRTGLLLDSCWQIHTCFMRFTIDALFLADTGEIVRAYDNLRPFRFASGNWRTRMTLELPAGTRLLQRLELGS